MGKSFKDKEKTLKNKFVKEKKETKKIKYHEIKGKDADEIKDMFK